MIQQFLVILAVFGEESGTDTAGNAVFDGTIAIRITKYFAKLGKSFFKVGTGDPVGKYFFGFAAAE